MLGLDTEPSGGAERAAGVGTAASTGHQVWNEALLAQTQAGYKDLT